MRGVYTAEIKLSAWASTKSMLLLQAPAANVVELLSAQVSDCGTNVVNQQLEARIARVTTIGSPVGTSITPSPEEPGDQASGCTVTGGLTTDVTTISASQNVDHQGFSSLGGYQYGPVPEERAYVAPSAAIVLILPVAPGVAFDAVVQMKFREIG